MSDGFTAYRAISAEGARIGIASCLKCGAAIVIDPSDTVNTFELHDDWHKEIDSE